MTKVVELLNALSRFPGNAEVKGRLTVAGKAVKPVPVKSAQAVATAETAGEDEEDEEEDATE